MDKNKVLKFINSNEKGSKVKEIVAIEIQDYDGEEGCIGDNYIIECIMDITSPTGNPDDLKRTCFIKKEVLDEYIDKEEPIKWID